MNVSRFLLETMQTKRQENNIFTILEGKLEYYIQRMYPSKNEGEIDLFKTIKRKNNSCLADPHYNKC